MASYGHLKVDDLKKLLRERGASLKGKKKDLVERFTNEIFFSYLNWSAADSGFRIRVCHLYNKTCNDIQEVIDGQAIAYDRTGKGVFFGGKKGIYKYNHLKKSAIQVRTEPRPVSRIFVQKNVYIIRNEVLYVLKKNDSFVEVPEAKGMQIQNFFVSKDISIYFSNATGLYKVDRPGKPIFLLSNKINVTQITEDYENGGVFFAANDGVYMDFVPKRTIRRVSDIKRVFGIAFWNPNPRQKKRQLIYSNNHGIFALRSSNHSKFCLRKKRNKASLARLRSHR